MANAKSFLLVKTHRAGICWLERKRQKVLRDCKSLVVQCRLAVTAAAAAVRLLCRTEYFSMCNQINHQLFDVIMYTYTPRIHILLFNHFRYWLRGSIRIVRVKCKDEILNSKSSTRIGNRIIYFSSSIWFRYIFFFFFKSFSCSVRRTNYEDWKFPI